MPDAGSNKGWFASLPNDSVLKTVIVATVLCLICSVVVSATAVGLRPLQQRNAILAMKQEILRVAGLDDPSRTVEESFSRIETRIIDLSTGQIAADNRSRDFRFPEGRPRPRNQRGDTRRPGHRQPQPAATLRAGLPGPGRRRAEHDHPAGERLWLVVDDVRFSGPGDGWHHRGGYHVLSGRRDAGTRRRDRQPALAARLGGQEGLWPRRAGRATRGQGHGQSGRCRRRVSGRRLVRRHADRERRKPI